MQHYLLDSNQRLNVSFSKDSVAAYYQCFNQPYRKEVPPLMCASLWSKFDLFKKYANSEFIEEHEQEMIAINDDGEIKIKISLSTKK
ncbi:hypothetical protein OMDLDMCL_OMDLDMCL_00714 [Staphylococcus aureus]|uniref:hypothetical protein n=1 Tax=Staphylococcus aureus TaxID=1280 RepID=UPI0024346D22|nr:hypothetical protein [Staphylococcus aureus]CAI2985354.1 hypothetical protein OMDLDMCL_OMDLDMCL_00714 [Staphylococcus aureus]